MEIATSQLPRIVRLALIGVGTAFAWIVVSLLLGLGLGQAHADETDDGGLLEGALGAATLVVDTTATAVTGTVSSVTTGVTGVVNSVVAEAPAPVQQPVSHVVQTVGTAVASVTQPVSGALSGGVVREVAQPVVDLATQVPVVGSIVGGVGLDEAVTDLGSTVDETLAGAIGAVDETGRTVGQPSAGDSPSIPRLPAIPSLPGLTFVSDAAPAAQLAGDAADADSPALFASGASVSPSSAGFTTAWGAASVTDTAATDGVALIFSAALSAGGSSGSAGGLGLPSASAGPGGAGPGAWALAAFVPLAAHRAWVRRAGPEDEHAPPAPTGSTDVFPD